jgi:hypothetical protein
MKLRNTFYSESDGVLAAIVESVIIWFDLAARIAMSPPEDLKDIWLSLDRTSDFAWYDGEVH